MNIVEVMGRSNVERVWSLYDGCASKYASRQHCGHKLAGWASERWRAQQGHLEVRAVKLGGNESIISHVHRPVPRVHNVVINNGQILVEPFGLRATAPWLLSDHTQLLDHSDKHPRMHTQRGGAHRHATHLVLVLDHTRLKDAPAAVISSQSNDTRSDNAKIQIRQRYLHQHCALEQHCFCKEVIIDAIRSSFPPALGSGGLRDAALPGCEVALPQSSCAEGWALALPQRSLRHTGPVRSLAAVHLLHSNLSEPGNADRTLNAGEHVALILQQGALGKGLG